jgi:amino acid adenylation domain-containing protein
MDLTGIPDELGLSEEKRRLLAYLLDAEAVEPLEESVIPPRSPADAPPLSFAQQRLWLLDQLQPNTALYLIASAVQMHGSLDVGVLRRSLSALVQRHETLRTTFATASGRPVQRIAGAIRWTLPLVDLHGLPADARQAGTQRLLVAEAQRPFDLARGPLLRTTLLRVAPDEHILLLTLHHIIADGWSLEIFIRELTSFYAAYATGQAAPLPALPIQYADFAIWQRQTLVQDGTLAADLAYWRTQLAGAPTALELPTDRPRPTTQAFAGAGERFTISPELTAGLQTLSQHEDSTLFMTLLAAFQALLARYSGQDDILVGTPIANRTHPQLADLIGFFVNLLVVRTDLSGSPTARELLRRVRRVCLDAYAHQELPFEQLVEALQPERDLSRTPLFTVAFALQHAPPPLHKLSGLSVRPLELEISIAKYDLTFTLIETPAGLRGSVEYSTALFDAATVARMVAHFQMLLAGIVAHPERQIATLPLLTAEEQQMLVAGNTTAAYPDSCVQTLFAAQAAYTPDAVAVTFGAEHLSYRELNERANRLAHFLRAHGVGRASRAGVSVERSINLIVGLLGVLKAGAAYVPIEPDYPRERLRFILEDSRAQVLITTTDDRRPTTDDGGTLSFVKTVDLVADWPLIARLSATNPVDYTTAADHVYVIYTSGSTGQPKGVVVPHHAVTRLVLNTNYVALSAADRIAQASTAGFDAATFEIWGALLHGARLVGITRHSALSPHDFAAQLHAQAITVLFTTTALFNQMARAVPAAFRGLNDLLFGGEAVAPEWVRAVLHAGAPRRLLHVYGPTESTTFASWYPIQDVPDDAGTIPIGRALANTAVYVLDREFRLVPVGVLGEVFIGGAGLAWGYLGRPDLTAERFVPNPFVTPEDERRTTNDDNDTADQPFVRRPASFVRLYQTGDLARYQADGNIVFVGRSDEQVKIRGFRIEPAEIEAVLGQHPAVRERIVVVRADTPGDKRLVAYVVTTNDQRPTTEAEEHDPSVVRRPSSVIPELRDFLKARLPDYMLPSAFVLLDALPLNANGKVDRQALPAPGHARPAIAHTFVAPRTPVEELVSGIWADVLNLDRVGVADNFFELGGHSLLATQVIARIRDAFQTDLALRHLFETPTVQGLALAIADARHAAPCAPPPLEPATRDRELPLAFAQQRLWFLDQLAPQSALYNVPIAVRLSGTTNPAALRSSVQALVQRHEILRTTFPSVDGQPYQLIAPAMPIALGACDLSALPAIACASALVELATLAAQSPFDLTRGPLLRTTLLRLAPSEHVLLLTLHHIIADGWSLGVFIRELAVLYAHFSAGVPATLPALPIQYADYATWQRSWLHSADADQPSRLQTQLDYWRHQLADAPTMLNLPMDRPRPANPTFAGRRQVFKLPHALAASLEAFSRQSDATLFMTLLGAFQTLLARYSGQHDIVVGAPIAGRTRAELEPLIGCFVNTLVLRGDLSGEPSFRALLGRLRAVCLDAYAHQELPFEQLVEELHPARGLGQTPLFQVVLALQNAPLPVVQLANLTLAPLDIESLIVKFDLTLTIIPTEQGLTGSLGYPAELFDATTITRLLGHFATLLAGIVADPDRTITELPLLTAAERQQVLVDWNATQVAYPAAVGLHGLFEAQAARVPDSVALVYDGPATGDHRSAADTAHITYAVLQQRANQLARYLRRRGIGPEGRVGICMVRSLDLVIGLLGILTAGAAYVPLDPTYPPERLSFMLADANVALVLIATPRLQDRAAGRPGNVELDNLLVALSPYLGTVADLRSEWSAIAQESDAALASELSDDNLAYLIYTSGSTGVPKGVMIPHRGIVNRLRWGQDAYRLSSDDRVLQKAPFSFDASIWEIFWPLTVGAQLVLARPNRQQDSAYLIELVTRHQITIIHFVPSMLEIFLEEPAVATCRSLRRVFCGGEPLPPRLKQRCLEQLAVSLHNQYGPTETSVNAIFWTCRRGQSERSIAIGRPIANIQAYILDARRQPVPIGVAGELFIGGAGLARGYHERPALTAERFVPCADEGRTTKDDGPASSFVVRPSSGDRLYRTGDLARFRPDGSIVFLGRIDHQVKLRGFRVELGEIEAILGQHPAVRERVVLMREDVVGDQRLVAYVVPTDDEGRRTNDERADSSCVTELRTYLATQLPDYMLPSAFVLLDALPLSPSGKIDRRALPAPDHARPGTSTPFVAPRSAIENRIAQIWTDVLGVEQIGVNDSFFDLGGHSLLATRVISRVREALQIELPLRTLFETPTVAGLAQAVTQREEQPNNRLLTPIERLDKTEEELLADLDQLSDAEVEALLGTLSDEGETLL